MTWWHCTSAGVKEQSKCFLLTFRIGVICDISETIWKIYSVYEMITVWMTANLHNHVMWMTANRLNGSGSVSNRGICIWWSCQITDGRMQLNITTGSQDSWDRKALKEQDTQNRLLKAVSSPCMHISKDGGSTNFFQATCSRIWSFW